MMLIKILLLMSCLVIKLSLSQTPSTCNENFKFTFYNGFDSESGTEQEWNWKGQSWDSAAALDFSILTVTVNGTNKQIGQVTPSGFSCVSSSESGNYFSFASYTWTYLDLFMVVTREFYVPTSASWMRVVDSVQNARSESINVTWGYNNAYKFAGTSYSQLKDYYWISYDTSATVTDIVVSSMVAMSGSLVLPTKINGFNPPTSYETYKFKDVTIPAGESRSIMTIYGQYNDQYRADSDATFYTEEVPEELLLNITDVMNIVNWVTCESSLEPPTERFSCSSAFSPTFTVSNFVTSVSVNDNPMTITNNQFSSRVINGANSVSYNITTGRSFTCQYDFIAPDQDLDISLDLTGATPVPTATGGYGGYSFNVTVSSDGLTALVNVTDQQGCTASKEFDIPPPAPQSAPQNGPHTVPQSNAPASGPTNPSTPQVNEPASTPRIDAPNTNSPSTTPSLAGKSPRTQVSHASLGRPMFVAGQIFLVFFVMLI